jgi:SAM-dependent methyltransferase
MYDEVKRSLSQIYDKYAHTRDKRKMASWKVEERAHFLALLQREEKSTLLEIGAGTGQDSLFFKENGLKTLSTDLSPMMVKLCQAKGLDAAVMSFDQLTFPDFPDASFDAIWALNCLLHVPKADIPAILSNLHRILKPGGLFYMGTYGGFTFEGIWEDDFYSPKRFYAFYPDHEIQKIVSDTFDLYYFKAIAVDNEKPHFQSMILRKA